tara:strand:- start:149 stop:349 length:201 start_codon:yes stop_codon:yes gene_type:complete
MYGLLLLIIGETFFSVASPKRATEKKSYQWYMLLGWFVAVRTSTHTTSHLGLWTKRPMNQSGSGAE